METFFNATLPLAIVLVSVFVYAGIAAGHNKYQIENGFNISHLWQTRERVAVVAFLVVAAYHGYRFPHWWGWLAPAFAMGAAACLFGLRFDIRLNLRRLLPRDYVGTDPQTAASDKTIRARGISGKTYARLKLAGTLLLAAAALLLSSCRSSDITRKPDGQLTETNVPKSAPVAAGPASAGSTAPSLVENKSLRKEPEKPLTPGQQRRLIRAESRAAARVARAQPRTVPKKLAKGASFQQATGENIQQQSGYKPAAPQAQATDSATIQQATAKQGPAVTAGRDAEVPVTTTEESWLRPLLPWLAGVGGVVLLHGLLPILPVAGAGWLLGLVRRRKTTA